jgi:hypothetical protein
MKKEMYHGTKTTLCTFSENAPYVQDVYNHMPTAKLYRHKNARIEKTILVATGQISKEELSKTSPYAVNSLDEIEIFI